ncbi:MAG: Gfo/Idh/MocA family protein [Chloroflexota bacterium]
MSNVRRGFAIVGAGDVAHRRYLPALRRLADRVEIAAIVDPRDGAADAAVESIADWSPGAASCRDLADLDGLSGLDAAVDLTPAPLHGATNERLLDTGLHVYSEKPIASDLPQADRLIDLARRTDRLLLCAPGTAATSRFRWLVDFAADHELGRPSLVVGQHADPGPAAWREYTGDPTPFYGPGIGPVFDEGVYRLHEMTVLMGPVRRVQAIGAISKGELRVRGGPLAGRTIPVTTPDHVLINLEFDRGGLGQLLASFGTANTMAPWLEVHFAQATLSFGGRPWDPAPPVSLYLDDEGPEATEGWQHGLEVPAGLPVVEAGITHFVDCLTDGRQPVLTAEHARHVLDIILKAYASIEDGQSHATETTF